jgi:hypothetical protein
MANRGRKEVIFNQFFGIGDIMFIEPIMRRSFQAGHKVILPVLDKYYDIKRHFPYIGFIKKDKLNIDYENQKIVDNGTQIIYPVRWSREFFKSPLNYTMMNKYKMFDLPLDTWREFTFLRDMDTEQRLMDELELPEHFNLINHNWHSFNDSHRGFTVDNGMVNIEMRFIPGYTLLDWASVIERASTIHSVNTALLYLLETLDVTDDLFLYSRRADGKDYKNTEYLRTKKYELL